MYAVGGWFTSNQAKIGVYLDHGSLIGFGGVGLTNAPAFFGVIDTDGFNTFKFQEQEGTKEDAKYIFSDDFTIALAPGGCGANTPPTADFTFVQTDATVDFTDTSSDIDGSVVQWLWDFGDGNYSNEQNPSHTYIVNGSFPVTLYVRDDGKLLGNRFFRARLIEPRRPGLEGGCGARRSMAHGKASRMKSALSAPLGNEALTSSTSPSSLSTAIVALRTSPDGPCPESYQVTRSNDHWRVGTAVRGVFERCHFIT